MTSPSGPLDPRRIFRESALKKHLIEGDTDEVVALYPSYWRFAVSYLIILFVILCLWLFLGALTIELKGRGIFLNKGGIFNIEAQSSGFVSRLLVQPGSLVKKGDPLVQIYDAEQEISLKAAQKQLDQLEKDYEALKREVTLEEENRAKALKEQIEINKEKIKKLTATLPLLEEEYKRKKRLLQEGGLVSNSSVLEAEKLLVQRRISLESTKSTLATLEANLKKSYRAEDLRAMEQSILVSRERRDLLELNMKYIQLYSPMDARLLEHLVKEGDIVTPGKKIMSIESVEGGEQNLIVYGFSYAEIGKNLPLGMQVLIVPTNVNSQEFGSLVGSLTDVSSYTISNEEIYNLIHSYGLIEYLTTGAPTPYLLTIKPEIDPSTVSGFKWTSKEGPPIKISTGTVCSITGIAYYERPVVRLIPFWRLEAMWDKFSHWVYSLFDEKRSE